MKNRHAYQELIDLVHEHGGSMTYDREGAPGVTYTIRLRGLVKEFETDGQGAIPELDRLYKLKSGVHDRIGAAFYSNDLKPDAWEQLKELLSLR